MSSTVWLPPGVFCVVEASIFTGYICGLCRDPRRAITGIQIPNLDALNTGELSLVFDVAESILPSSGSTLTVGAVHVNPRPAVFCDECYPALRECFSQPGRGVRLFDIGEAA